MKDDLWWVLPGQLAGMPMPFLHPERRARGGGSIDDFDDDLRQLKEAGISAVVSLLNLPGDARIYQDAGFEFHLLSIPDGGAPALEEADEMVRFIGINLIHQRAVAVHCSAGLGRTGTMLAAYLIATGSSASAAIERIRALEPAAIETNRQVQFLRDFELRPRST